MTNMISREVLNTMLLEGKGLDGMIFRAADGQTYLQFDRFTIVRNGDDTLTLAFYWKDVEGFSLTSGEPIGRGCALHVTGIVGKQKIDITQS